MNLFKKVLAILCIVLIVLSIGFFGIEKNLPDSYTKNNTKILTDTVFAINLESIENAGNFVLNMVDEKVTYSGENTTYNYKKSYEFKKTGKGENLVVIITTNEYNKTGNLENTSSVKYFKNNGDYFKEINGTEYKISENDWQNTIITSFAKYCPIESKSGKFLNSEIFYNNITAIKQKGFKLTILGYKDNYNYKMKMNFINKMVYEYDIIKKTSENINEHVCYTMKNIKF